MQNRHLKNLKFLFILFLFISQPAVSQSVDSQLFIADSLFQAKRYTQSLKLYEELYNQEEAATPAMLLKMAYSQEAMGNLSKALVYLHDYYRFTGDESVVKKMDELASVNGLEGYESTEFMKVQKFLYDQQYWIFLALVAVGGIIIFMMLRKLKKHNEKSPSLAISLALVMALGVYVLNFTQVKDRGIILNDNAFIMSGPSAAAELIEVASQGHKVEIIGSKDVWVEVNWKGQKAYIRQSNIQALL
ncbi:hypothetical protein GBO34_09320 [Roseivirga pacifica]|nr:hypothetical protein [Roseivirga pacifica]MCO6365754.1 hypothetical protein [Roseivirga pacifica]MCO6371516.1 hypothetical protein [Roseivirga pacifica]MCO6376373.1 hypothetical protein [Roseivirga pacifica]MCO6378894.1 hypothetical protein [Roseivirga pacifica]